MIRKIRIEWVVEGERKNQEFKDTVDSLELQGNLKLEGTRYELHVLSDKADEYNGFVLLPNIWCRVG